MACRDGDASPLEEQYFKEQKARQIAAKVLGGFSENYFTKMKISRAPVVRSCSKASKIKINAFRFGWFQREVWEIFSRGERLEIRSAVWARIWRSLHEN